MSDQALVRGEAAGANVRIAEVGELVHVYHGDELVRTLLEGRAPGAPARARESAAWGESISDPPPRGMVNPLVTTSLSVTPRQGSGLTQPKAS